MGAYSPDPGSICVYCGSLATVLDHLVARSSGGGGGSNLVPACDPCNAGKRHHEVVKWLSGQVVAAPIPRRRQLWARLAGGDISRSLNDPSINQRVSRAVFRRIVSKDDRLAWGLFALERVGPVWEPFLAQLIAVDALIGAEGEEES
jgi:hypothetical protein